MIISYSLVDNELDDNDDDDTSPHREKRNAVKGNLNIVNKFARHEEVRNNWEHGAESLLQYYNWSNSVNYMD